MKFICGLICFLPAFAAPVNPQLKQVSTIYILGMSGGMDQYLANQITSTGTFQVVTDPQHADAVITDRLGETFETKLRELSPRDNAAAGANAANNSDLSGGARVSSLGRGRGNFFIVDRKSGAVLWSVFEEPKDNTPAELTKTAHKIVRRLKNDLTEKK